MSTGDKGGRSGGGSFLAALRRSRIGLILLVCTVISLAALFTALWFDRGLVQYVAVDEMRRIIERDLGLEFRMTGSRVRFLPLRVVIDGAALGREGEPWTLTVEETEVSLALYNIVFRRTGAAKVSLSRPRFFYRASPGGGAPPVFPDLLAAGMRLRQVKIRDGEVRIDGEGAPLLRLGGIDVTAVLGGGKLLGTTRIGSGTFRRDGVDWDLGTISADLVAADGGITFREFAVDSPVAAADLSGSLGWLGEIDLEGTVSCAIGEVTGRLGRGRPLEGDLTFSGGIGGSLKDPRFEGRLALMEPLFRGVRWPGMKGSVSARGRRVGWDDLAVAVGRGKISSSGEIDFSGPLPRYAFEVSVQDFDPSRLPPFEKAAGAILPGGSLLWEGEGFAAPDLRGSGSVEAGFLFEEWKAGEVSLTAEASLDGGLLDLPRVRVTGEGIGISGDGSWVIGGELSARLKGGARDLETLLSHWGVEGYGGRLTAEGLLTASGAGVSFAGPLRWSEGKIMRFEGFDAKAGVSASGSMISLSDGLMLWKGGEIRGDGSLEVKGKNIDIITAWRDLPAVDVAALFGIEGEGGGSIGGHGRLVGPWPAARLTGRFQGDDLRYGGAVVGKAAGNVVFDGGSLEVSDVSLRSGESEITFGGGLGYDLSLYGSFESPSFDLRAFLPDAAADVTGSISGRLGGGAEKPELKGQFSADRLDYRTWSFKETAGTFEYSDGAFRLLGHLAEEVNRYSIAVDPSGDWPFEVIVSLERFSPELAREGFLGLPAKMRDVLEGLSFLAVASFEARGRLRDVSTISADLGIETIWVYTEEQTLQNVTPLHIAWREGTMTVDPFTIAGEGYGFSVAGGGGFEQGWDLLLDGEVNLSMFEGWWEELEAVDAPGNVVLRLSGPWEEPVVGGTVTFRGGSVKLRSLPDPIVDLRGDGELSGTTFSVADFSGKMGEGTFIAGGIYDFETLRVDALIEGTLDLALFQRRLPFAREMSGPVEVHLSLQGPAASPEIFGEARLAGAEVLLQSMSERVSDLTGTVIMEERRIELREMAGRMGSGEVSLAGEVDWRSDPAKVDFTFTGRKLTMVVPETAKTILDADLTLKGDFDGLALEGKIGLLKTRWFREFRKKFENLPSLPPAGGPRTGRGPDLGAMSLDVSVTAPDRLWVTNSMAKLETAAEVHLGGTVSKPLITGEVRLLRGTAIYFNRRFTLYSGRIFNEPPGFHPVLEAQAEVRVSDVVIHLLLEGPLGRPSLQLTSVPPLSQEDLFTLLTVGQTRSELGEHQTEALALGAALMLTTPVIEDVGESARDLAGLEIFQVEPSLDDERGGARVTVGTRISDRLFMSASQNVGVTEDQQLLLEYQLLDYISVLGQQLQQGIYGLDLVFQYAF